DDDAFLGPLNFGDPDRMYAIPLVARGRGVAVLYADHGENGQMPNLEALEMLVRVAGLTVELHASSQAARTGVQVAADLEDTRHDAAAPAEDGGYEPSDSAQTQGHGGFAFSESMSFEGGFPQTAETPPAVVSEEVSPEPETRFTSFAPPQAEVEPVSAEAFEYQAYDSPAVQEVEANEPAVAEAPKEEVPAYSESSFAEPAFAQEIQVETEEIVEEAEPAAAFESENSPFTSSPFDTSANEYAPAGVGTGGFEPAVETVVEAPAPPRARLSDRPVDLPIEVPEEERRSHNDARRFARLLVSEIKLYNEKKVTEGREARDLYERLREAIDRSREMYDKRVQPPVASKFDYFHFELVNSLAEGDDARLGSGYPGSSV
ncbi:MAG: hypothetical protein AB7J13_10220, partial [Pyrinomonadaceae bacterium]